MPKIFISYRREDSAYPAQQIYKELADRFGANNVTFDVDTIPLGADFREYLNNAVGKCDILLAVIGDQWTRILNERLDQPNDFVRIELTAALERQIPVVPVLVGKASVPGERDLPPELSDLAYRNAAEVRAGSDFDSHLRRLVNGLDRLLSESASSQPEVTLDSLIEPNKKIKNELGMTFVYIPPGTFMMGSPDSEPGRDDDEILHPVTLTKGFYMQTTQVTQAQWQAVMGDNPSDFSGCGYDCPVERVSWEDVQEFIDRLNQQLSDTGYRLPTEAEWEYAARAGSQTAFANGPITIIESGLDLDPNLDAMGWYCYNAHGKTHPVAQKAANDWGLYDMHGNVWEWCADWYDDYPEDELLIRKVLSMV
ncbi:SUMF1/EgtB/PvdO family nonheme iron enzyme [uncultured Desulfobacter sp.]|uniref:SUMF1/EgtB/PvdO family nonheme iron enzyme n=1 Tax=uncultured Desulfobacter sp. TaxID=240139 RepID=UPI0029F483E3|nr:SUMF1/EgtB/PvdO family nonheme iron enzyme [uncultured Desulfobacter sp.]